MITVNLIILQAKKIVIKFNKEIVKKEGRMLKQPIIILYSILLLIAQVSRKRILIIFQLYALHEWKTLWMNKIRLKGKSCYQNKSQFHARDTKPQLPVQIALKQIHCRLIIVQMLLYYYEILQDKFYPRGSRIFSRGDSLKKFTRNFYPSIKKK